jgi:hypothetical protein
VGRLLLFSTSSYTTGSVVIDFKEISWWLSWFFALQGQNNYTWIFSFYPLDKSIIINTSLSWSTSEGNIAIKYSRNSTGELPYRITKLLKYWDGANISSVPLRLLSWWWYSIGQNLSLFLFPHSSNILRSVQFSGLIDNTLYTDDNYIPNDLSKMPYYGQIKSFCIPLFLDWKLIKHCPLEARLVFVLYDWELFTLEGSGKIIVL